MNYPLLRQIDNAYAFLIEARKIVAVEDYYDRFGSVASQEQFNKIGEALEILEQIIESIGSNK